MNFVQTRFPCGENPDHSGRYLDHPGDYPDHPGDYPDNPCGYSDHASVFPEPTGYYPYYPVRYWLICIYQLQGPQDNNIKFANPVVDIAASSRVGDLFGQLASWGWAAV